MGIPGAPGPQGEKGSQGYSLSGVIYNRWGRTTCYGDALLVYNGKGAGCFPLFLIYIVDVKHWSWPSLELENNFISSFSFGKEALIQIFLAQGHFLTFKVFNFVRR